MNAAQCRMARAALQLSVRDLATLAKVSTDTIVRLERDEELKERTAEAVQRALEDGGLLRIEKRSDEWGVLLLKSPDEIRRIIAERAGAVQSWREAGQRDEPKNDN
jgi:transcriptional regulator with XRE-family HTH domain